jgi:serine/threonine protein kinase
MKMANGKRNDNRKKIARHVIFCGDADFMVKGSKAEMATVQFLLNSLPIETVGDYRVLVNYNVMKKDSGNSLEVDVLVIDRLGIFLLEVKDWHGSIESLNSRVWLFRGSHERKNAWVSIDHKAKVFHSQLFDVSGSFPHMSEVSVIGMVVLTQGLRSFVSRGQDNTQRIVDLSPRLTQALSTHRVLHRGTESRPLSDPEIQAIQKSLHKQHQPKEMVVRHYRWVKTLALRDLYDIFEVQDTQFANRRVRLKRYQLPSLDPAMMEISIRHFRRSAEAVFALGSHPHLLQTHDFFPDEIRQQEGVFYEITELPSEYGLGEVMQNMMRQERKMAFDHQLSFLKPICLALQHAHNHKDEDGKSAPVYHRSICPEAVFQMRDGTVKLGDFDFAKFGDETISVPGQILIATPYTAPELLKNSSLANARSDIYALGVLWYCMASLPDWPEQFKAEEIDSFDLPDDACALMKRMTAENPIDRPENIEEVLEILSLYQEM